MSRIILALLLLSGVAYGDNAGNAAAGSTDKSVTKPEASSVAAEPKSAKANEEFIKEQLAGIRNELEQIESSKSLTVKPYAFGDKGLCIDIEYREGKSFLFFKGRRYQLSLLDEDGDGKLDRVDFSFKDNSERDETIAIKKVFRQPFDETIAAEFGQILDQFKHIDRNKGFADFINPKKIYEKYIKQPIVDRLK